MTPEQKLDAERLDRYLLRESLVPILNNTKWQRLIECITEIPNYSVRFRVKCVRDTNFDADYWDGSFPWHVPRPFKTIEWIDFNPLVHNQLGQLLEPQVNDFTDDICGTLTSNSIPHEVAGAAIRVYGYKRPT